MLIYLQTIEDEADKIKFAVIYQRYRNLMFHIAATFLSDPRDREEAVQEAFSPLRKTLPNFLTHPASKPRLSS